MPRPEPQSADRLFLQATALLVEGVGVLIRGPSGSGKSDLALRLIDAGARLVADDGVELSREGRRLVMRLPAGAPEATRGRLEARSLGILPVPAVDAAPLDLVVDLVPPKTPAESRERLPGPAMVPLLGLDLPAVRLAGLEASAAAKVRLAVRASSGFIIAPP